MSLIEKTGTFASRVNPARITSMILSLLLCATVGAGQETFETPPFDPGKLVKEQPYWEDEFNGTALDGSKWDTPTMERQNNSALWTPSLVKVAGGNLELGVVRDGPPGSRYLAGAVRTRANYDPKQTKFEKVYGYFEIRARLPKTVRTDVWFAFWIMAGDLSGKNDDSRKGAEIDIMESFFSWENAVSQAVHWGGYGDKLNSAAFPKTPVGDLDRGGWHTYGLLWTPREYAFYVDRKCVTRTKLMGLGRPERALSKGPCQEPGYLKLTCEASAWAGPSGEWEKDGPVKDEALIDYVRVWDLPKELKN